MLSVVVCQEARRVSETKSETVSRPRLFSLTLRLIGLLIGRLIDFYAIPGMHRFRGEDDHSSRGRGSYANDHDLSYSALR